MRKLCSRKHRHRHLLAWVSLWNIKRFNAQHKKVYQIPNEQPWRVGKNVTETQSWMHENDNFMHLIKRKIHWETDDATKSTKTDKKCGLKPTMLMQVLQCFYGTIGMLIGGCKTVKPRGDDCSMKWHFWSFTASSRDWLLWLKTVFKLFGLQQKAMEKFPALSFRTYWLKSCPKAPKTGRPFMLDANLFDDLEREWKFSKDFKCSNRQLLIREA